MGSEFTIDQIPVIFTHHPDAYVWESETTLTARDPYPGVVTPDDGYESARMVWSPAGDYDSGSPTVYLQIERGGWQDEAARFVKSTDGSTWYGHDAFTHLSHYEAVEWTTLTTPRNGNFDVAEGGDGTLVAVTDFDESNNGTQIRVHTKAPGGSWAALGTLTLDADHYPAGMGAYPTLVPRSDGSVLLLVQRHFPSVTASNDRSTVDVYLAEADADWTVSSPMPFQLQASDALRVATTFSSGGNLGRMDAAVGGDQLLLLLGDISSSQILQYVSADGGASFTSVDTITGASNQDFSVAWTGSQFLVAYVNGGSLKVKGLADASTSFEEATATTLGSANGERPLVHVDEEGGVWVLCQASGAYNVLAYYSADGGSTWSGSTVEVLAGDSAAIGDMAACVWRGRTVLLHTTDSATGWTESLVAAEFGGWATWTMPRESNVLGGRLVWDNVWTSRTTIAAASGWAWGTTGTVTPSWHTSGDFQVVTAAASTATATATLSGVTTPARYAIRAVLDVDAGSCDLRVRSADLHVLVTYNGTNLIVNDQVAVATLKNAATSGGRREVIVIVDTAGDEVLVLERAVDGADDRAFSTFYSGALSATTGLTPTIAAEIPASSTVRLRILGSLDVGPEYEVAPSLPYGRVCSSAPLWLHLGVFVSTYDGPAIRGQRWTMSAGSRFALDRAAATRDYPSPRTRFESSGTTNKILAYRVADLDQNRRSPVWAGFIETNAETVRLDFHDGSSWTTGPTIKTGRTWYTQIVGASAISDGTPSATPTFVERNELVDGYAEVASGDVHRIVANSEGVLDTPSAGVGRLAVATLDTDTDDGALATTTLWYPRASFVVDSAHVPANVQGFRFVLSGTVPPEGYYRLKCACGPAVPLGRPHGMNTTRDYPLPMERQEGEGGFLTTRRTAPSPEVLEVSWQDGVDIWVHQVRGTSAPDYLLDSNGVGIFLRGSTHSTLRSFIMDHGPEGDPVGWIPKWVPADGSTRFERLRAGGFVLGVLDGPWRVEHINGEEYTDDDLREGMVRLRELT